MAAIAVAICILAGVSSNALHTLAILLIVWEGAWIFARVLGLGKDT